MLRSFGRFLKAISHKFSGIFIRKTDKLIRDADTMRGGYEEVIYEKRKSMQHYITAVAEMAALNEGRLSRVSSLTEDVSRLEKVMAGALSRAKKRQEELAKQGKISEEILHDEEMVKLRAAYSDAKSTCDSKKEQITSIENEISTSKSNIEKHKIELQRIQKDIENLSQEKIDAIADVKASEFNESIANTLSGINNDKTDEKLAVLRAARNNAKAKAAIAREMAGTDYGSLEEELASLGEISEGAAEFDKLLAADTVAPEKNKEIVEEELELDLR